MQAVFALSLSLSQRQPCLVVTVVSASLLTLSDLEVEKIECFSFAFSPPSPELLGAQAVGLTWPWLVWPSPAMPFPLLGHRSRWAPLGRTLSPLCMR